MQTNKYRNSRNFGEKNIVKSTKWLMYKCRLHLLGTKFDEMTACSFAPHFALIVYYLW